MGRSAEDIDQSYEGKNKEILRDLEKDGWAMTPFVDRADYFKEQGYDVENKGGVFMIKSKDNKLDHEIVNDFSIDAIKDNFTPPGAKGEKKMSKRMFSPDMLCPKCKEPMLYQTMGGKIKCSKCGNEVGKEELDNLDLYKSPHGTSSLEDFIPPGAEDEYDLYDQMESMGDLPSDMQLHKALKKVDTNDNGEIEVDEMADFQKSLDDYASKNKKGREDIPATYKR